MYRGNSESVNIYCLRFKKRTIVHSKMAKIEVLRLEHRKKRDPRVSTHVCLAARAFGASAIYYSGERDLVLEKTVRDVVKNWGGPFSIKYIPQPRSFIKNYRGKKVNLTMYGLPFAQSTKRIAQSRKPILVIIGGAKVPGWVYGLSDYNLAVTNQPHSEVAALSVFLYEFFAHREKKFKSAKLKIVPQARGKKFSNK